MARLLRVDRPSLWYHLTGRGNEQRLTFRDDGDREHFLELLAQWVDRFRLRLHAYMLMPNHYHRGQSFVECSELTPIPGAS